MFRSFKFLQNTISFAKIFYLTKYVVKVEREKLIKITQFFFKIQNKLMLEVTFQFSFLFAIFIRNPLNGFSDLSCALESFCTSLFVSEKDCRNLSM